MLLADKLRERARPHALGERSAIDRRGIGSRLRLVITKQASRIPAVHRHKGCIIIAEKNYTSDRRITETRLLSMPGFPSRAHFYGQRLRNLHRNAVMGICVLLASARKP